MPIGIRNPEVKRLARLLSERDEANAAVAIKTALTDVLEDSVREAENRRSRIIAIA